MDNSTRDANDSLPHSQGPNLHILATIEQYMKIIVPITCLVIIVIGGIGNLLVILSVSLYKHMRSRRNVFILNLAVADLLFIIVVLPFNAIDFAFYYDDYQFGPVWCKLSGYITFVTFYASVYTLLGVSFNRFLAVVFPISSITFRTRSNAIKTVLVLWVVILLANIPVLNTNDLIKGKTHTLCDTTDKKSEKMTHGAWIVFGFALPLALMCIMYGIIAIHLLRRSIPSDSSHGGNSQIKTRAIRMCAVVVTVFTLCLLPFHIWNMWRLYGKQIDLAEIVAFYVFGYASILLVYTNSCVNPILYAFLCEEFRSSFRKLMRCNSIRKCPRCKTKSATPQVNILNAMTDRPSSSRTLSRLNRTADSTVSE